MLIIESEKDSKQDTHDFKTVDESLEESINEEGFVKVEEPVEDFVKVEKPKEDSVIVKGSSNAEDPEELEEPAKSEDAVKMKDIINVDDFVKEKDVTKTTDEVPEEIAKDEQPEKFVEPSKVDETNKAETPEDVKEYKNDEESKKVEESIIIVESVEAGESVTAKEPGSEAVKAEVSIKVNEDTNAAVPGDLENPELKTEEPEKAEELTTKKSDKAEEPKADELEKVKENEEPKTVVKPVLLGSSASRWATASSDSSEPEKPKALGASASRWATSDPKNTPSSKSTRTPEPVKTSRWAAISEESSGRKLGSMASKWANTPSTNSFGSRSKHDDRYDVPAGGRLNRSAFEDSGRLNRSAFEDTGRLNRDTFEDHGRPSQRGGFESFGGRNNYYDKEYDSYSRKGGFDNVDNFRKDRRRIEPQTEEEIQAIKNWNAYQPPPDENDPVPRIPTPPPGDRIKVEKKVVPALKPAPAVVQKPIPKPKPLLDIDFVPITSEFSWADDVDMSSDEEEEEEEIEPVQEEPVEEEEKLAPVTFAWGSLEEKPETVKEEARSVEEGVASVGVPKLVDQGKNYMEEGSKYFNEDRYSVGSKPAPVEAETEAKDEAPVGQQFAIEGKVSPEPVKEVEKPPTYTWGSLEVVKKEEPKAVEEVAVDQQETVMPPSDWNSAKEEPVVVQTSWNNEPLVTKKEEEKPAQPVYTWGSLEEYKAEKPVVQEQVITEVSWNSEPVVQEEAVKEVSWNSAPAQEAAKPAPVYTWGSLEEPKVETKKPVEESAVVIDEESALHAWSALGQVTAKVSSVPDTADVLSVAAPVIEMPKVEEQQEWKSNFFWDVVTPEVTPQVTPAWGTQEDVVAPAAIEKPVVKDSWKDKLPAAVEDNASKWKSFADTVAAPVAPVSVAKSAAEKPKSVEQTMNWATTNEVQQPKKPEVLSGSFGSQKAREVSFSLSDLQDAPQQRKQTQEISFSLSDLQDAPQQRKQPQEISFSLSDLQDAPQQCKQPQEISFSLSDLQDVATTRKQPRDISFSLSDLQDEKPKVPREIFFSLADLGEPSNRKPAQNVSFSLSDLNDAPSREPREVSFNLNEARKPKEVSFKLSDFDTPTNNAKPAWKDSTIVSSWGQQ